MAVADSALDVPKTRAGHGAIFLIVLLFAGLSVRLLSYEMRVDEQLYISPAALLGEGSLYVDFFYNHVPLSALYFRVIHLALGEEHLVLAARLGVLIAWALTLVAVWLASLRLSQSTRVALFCVLALEANVYLLTVPGMTATNNLLQLGPVYAGLALFALAVVDRHHKAWKAFFSGVALSIAAGIKIGAAVVIPPLALAAFFLPWGMDLRARLRAVTLPMALGGLVGAIPLIIYLGAFPDLFLAHVMGYHTGPHVAYWEAMRHTEPTLAFDPADKFRLAFEIWLQSTNLVIVLAVSVLGAWGHREPRRRREPARRRADRGSAGNVRRSGDEFRSDARLSAIFRSAAGGHGAVAGASVARLAAEAESGGAQLPRRAGRSGRSAGIAPTG